MTEKENSLESGLESEVQGSQEINRLPARVNRYSKAKKRSYEMQQFLQEKPLYHDEYLKLKGCGNYLKFLYYYTIDKVRLHQAMLCRKHLLCNLCALIRGGKHLRVSVDRLNFILSQNKALRCSMVTLTTKNGPDLSERFGHQKISYSKLEAQRRQSQSRGDNVEWGKVLGLLGAYEVTNNGNGWHVHQHICVLHEEKIYHGNLAKQWHAITGDSNIIDVSPFQHPDNPAIDLVEVLKYTLKFGDMSLGDNLKAYDVLSGKRLFFSAGIMRGIKIPESLMDEPIYQADLPYIEILYRYSHGEGYQKKETYKVPF